MTGAGSTPLRTVAAFGLPGSELAFPQDVISDAAWTMLLADGRRERLIGFLAAAAQDGALPLRESQFAAAVDAHEQAMWLSLTLERKLLEAVDVLAGMNVDVRVLKGSAVAHLDYAQAGLRPFGDVDLLVRSDQFDAAVTALSAAGYRRRHPEPRPGFDRSFSKGTSFVAPDGHELDLHRTFVMGPYGLSIDLDDLWLDGATFHVAGRSLSALSSEARIMHAAYHAVLGDWPPRLLAQRDLAEMVLFGDFDEVALRAMSHRWRGDAVLARAVHMTWETLQLADVTALSTWASRYEPEARDRRALAVYNNSHNNYAAKSLAAVHAIPRLRDRAAYLGALLFPQSTYLEGRHNGLAHRLRHGVRAVRSGRGTPS